MTVTPESMLPELLDIARKAGMAIMEVYGREFSVTIKDDDTPLTEADMAAHQCIVEALDRAFPDIPVLSEESHGIDPAQRSGWKTFFLVDPLDGTKGFVKRNDKFTVNIALIEEGRPTAGVVFAPVFDVLWYAAEGFGAWKIGQGGKAVRIHANSLVELEGLRVVASPSSPSPAVQGVLRDLPDHELLDTASSMKLCAVADGSADLYPRFAPTSEWDTAASHCVVNEAGGCIIDFEGHSLRYNKADILNPSFIVVGASSDTFTEQLTALIRGHAVKQCVRQHRGEVCRKDRERSNGHFGGVFWFTGLSSSGKSTIAHAVEKKLFDQGHRVYVFDGDNVRHGLCGDLSFSPAARTENVRRIAEVCRLFVDNGIICLCAFISPLQSDREHVEQIVGSGDYNEIYMSCPVSVCAKRDPKGYYKLALEGKIKNYTGVSAPYEEPIDPDLTIHSDEEGLEESVQKVFEFVLRRSKFSE